jgi:hypothetical protein
VFFLREADGNWSLVPVRSGYVGSVRDAFFVLTSDSKSKMSWQIPPASIHERVVAEVAKAADSTGGHPGGGSIDFVWEYRSNPSPAMRRLFAEFSSSADRRLRMANLRASISAGDEQAFTQLEQVLESKNQAEFMPVAEEIRSHVTPTEPQKIVRLGQLALTPTAPAEFRKACLTALARSHTRDTLPFVAEFLENSDIELQALAVGGLAMFANNVPAGSHEPAAGPWEYRTEETIGYSAMDPAALQKDPMILAFWKSWWAEHRVELQ